LLVVTRKFESLYKEMSDVCTGIVQWIQHWSDLQCCLQVWWDVPLCFLKLQYNDLPYKVYPKLYGLGYHSVQWPIYYHVVTSHNNTTGKTHFSSLPLFHSPFMHYLPFTSLNLPSSMTRPCIVSWQKLFIITQQPSRHP
jgi:hypothetical protein